MAPHLSSRLLERRRLGVPAGSEERPGSLIGELAVHHDPASVDEDVIYAVRVGVEPPGPPWEIETHRHVTAADGAGVEHDEVGVPAFGHSPAVLDPVETTLDIGQEMDGFLEGQEPVTPYGLAQELGGVVEGGEKVQVGARIGGTDHRAVVSPNFEARRPRSELTVLNRGTEERRPLVKGARRASKDGAEPCSKMRKSYNHRDGIEPPAS